MLRLVLVCGLIEWISNTENCEGTDNYSVKANSPNYSAELIAFLHIESEIIRF